MIEVRIYLDEVEIGRVRISNVEVHPDGTSDHIAEFAVDRLGAVGLHARPIRFFPRLKYNVLGLLLQALNTLTPKELELEPDVSSSDLARRQRGIGNALSRKEAHPFSDY